MSGYCSAQNIYKPFLNYQQNSSTIDLIIIATLLPVQFVFLIFVLGKGYTWLKKSISKRFLEQVVNYKQNEKNQKILIIEEQTIPKDEVGDKQQNQTHNNKSILEKAIAHPCLSITFTIFFLLLYILSLIFLTLSFLSIYQTSHHSYPQTQCHLNHQVNQFRKGSSTWLGLENLVPNVTQLSLVLNTRIQVSINAIRGILLNGTVAKIKPGLGFANGTNITVVNRQAPPNLTIIKSTSVKSNINATVRFWLFMNSSLSNITLFPVCQPNLTYPIQHPLKTGETIELNYMSDICGKVTKQVDDLVENGGKVDQLLVDLEEAKLMKTSLQSNLSALGQVYSPIALRTNEYGSQFSSFGHDFSTLSTLSMVSLSAYGGVGILMLLYIIFMYGVSCCSSESPQKKQDSQQNSSANVVVLSVRDRNDSNNNHNTNFFNISSSFPKLFMFLMIAVNVVVSILSYLSINKSIEINQNCITFNQSIYDTTAFNSLPLTASQKQLLTPIHQCTSNQSTYFMQSVPLLTSRFSLQKLYSLSVTYNASVPKDVFKSQSLAQVQTLKQYLFHLETMPIKSSQFNLLELLEQINLYSNGSYVNSKQLLQCGRTVIQDQYVYNAVDCRHKLMDLVTEVSITEPRCIILPTYDGTPGTATTHLNQAQHTFVLDATCPSINNMFSQTNSSCFLAKRLALLQAQNCSNTAKQLGTRLQNIVKFSQKASEYTDIYMQNLRNMFGIYAGSSTNLTQFFAGSNMSQTMSAFGVLSNNLLNRTKCQQIKPIVQSIYKSYCPESNSLPNLLSQAYIWSVIVVIAIVVQSIVFFGLDVLIRLRKVEMFYTRMDEEIKGKRVMPEVNDSRKLNVIEMSQETLVRDILREDDRIYQDQFNQILYQSPVHETKPIIILAQTTQPCTEIKPKQDNSHTLDETGMLFDKYSPSPMKSINPYGNSDQVIQYPQIGNTPKKQQEPMQNFQQQQENKPTQQQINLLSSIKKPNTIQNEIFEEKDSSIEQQKPPEQKPANLQNQQEQPPLRQSYQRQGKLMMSQTARRFKKVNVQTDEKKIMPQLFFNLDDRNEGKSPELKGKIRANKNKTQYIDGNGVDKGSDIKSKNYLEINLYDDEEDVIRNVKDIEVMNLQRMKKDKKSKQRGNKKVEQDRKGSLTAR